MAWVEVHYEAQHPEHVASATRTPDGDWVFCLHWCTYHLADGDQKGYRFIWKRPDGSLAAQRGQARIPSRRDIDILWEIADREGWGGFTDADESDTPATDEAVTRNDREIVRLMLCMQNLMHEARRASPETVERLRRFLS
jgi:hypothetical protein